MEDRIRIDNGDHIRINKTITVNTNVGEIKNKVDKLQQLLEEANSIIQELASTDLEVHLNV